MFASLAATWIRASCLHFWCVGCTHTRGCILYVKSWSGLILFGALPSWLHVCLVDYLLRAEPFEMSASPRQRKCTVPWVGC